MVKIRTSPAGNAGGFTLMELLVVLAIIGFIASAFSGFLFRDQTAVDLDRATRMMTDSLRETRRAALSSNQDQLFRIDVERRQFVPGEGRIPIQIKTNIDIQLVTARRERLDETVGQIRFFGDGSSTGGEVTLALGNQISQIDVDWLTGLISASKDAP